MATTKFSSKLQLLGLGFVCTSIYSIYEASYSRYSIMNGKHSEDRKRDVVVILMKDLANEQTRLNSDNSVVCL